eukprot:scaffold16903_cov31-Tisochrysis_lutea.AAC.1
MRSARFSSSASLSDFVPPLVPPPTLLVFEAVANAERPRARSVTLRKCAGAAEAAKNSPRANAALSDADSAGGGGGFVLTMVSIWSASTCARFLRASISSSRCLAAAASACAICSRMSRSSSARAAMASRRPASAAAASLPRDAVEVPDGSEVHMLLPAPTDGLTTPCGSNPLVSASLALGVESPPSGP